MDLLKANITILITSHCLKKEFADIDLRDTRYNRNGVRTSVQGGALASAQGRPAVLSTLAFCLVVAPASSLGL